MRAHDIAMDRLAAQSTEADGLYIGITKSIKTALEKHIPKVIL
jgi:hypothetical protein